MKTTSTLFPSARKLSIFLQSYGPSILIFLITSGLGIPTLAAQSLTSGNVTLARTLTAIAGSGGTLPSTTAGAATSASLSGPAGVAVDASGNLYIADSANKLVEQVSPAGQIVVIAGGGTTVPSTTSQLATAALLNHPTGVAVDTSGNVYIADQGSALVEEVTGGQIMVVAGGGNTKPSTTSEQATAAQLNGPTGVAVDTSGNIYIADEYSGLVYEVSKGQIVILAGGGTTPPSTTPGPPTSAQLNSPAGVAVDAAGDVFIADLASALVEEVSAATQNLSIIAGGGSTVPSLTPEAGTGAQLNQPEGVAVDAAGDVFIADHGSNLVEELSAATQQIVVLAGGGSAVPSTTTILSTDASLNNPTGVVLGPTGNLYIADKGNNLVEEVAGGQATLPTTAVGATSSVETLDVQLQAASAISSITVPKLANGKQEFAIGIVTGCTVGGASNPAGTVCVIPVTFSPAYPGLRTGALTVNNGGTVVGTVGLYGIGQGPEIVQSPGGLSVIAGGGNTIPSTTAAAPLSTLLKNPTGIAVDGAGNIYLVAGDVGNATINEISAATGQITAIVGGGDTVPSTTPEPATSASIIPFGITVDGAGNIYIADYGNGVIEKVDATSRQIVVIAGSGANGPSTTPEPALTAAIYPFGVAIDKTGNLYIADKQGQYSGGQIEEIAAGTGQIVVVAGGGSSTPSSTPEPALTAGFYQITNVAVDGAGNYYIADAGDDRVEKVTVSTGQIVAIAGFGPNVPGTKPTAATDASLNNPYSVTVDAAGNVYIADTSNGLIEQVNPAGQIVLLAGGGMTTPATTATEAATSAQLYNPTGIAIDGVGNLYITDMSNNLVEKVSASALPLAFSDTYVGATNATQQTIALENIGNQPLNISSLSSTTDFPREGANACTTVASGSTCFLVYGFLPTTAGVLNETATLTDNNLNGTNAQQTISFSGTGIATIAPVNSGSYTLTANPSALTIAAGQTGTATLTLTPVGNYKGSVTLNCSNLPADTTCAFAQSGGSSNSTIMLSGNNKPVQITLTIKTSVSPNIAAVTEQSPLNPILPALAFWWPGSIVGFAALGRRKKAKRYQLLLQIGVLVLMTGAMAGLIAGCGGGGSNSSTNTTPAGTTTVTVTSTAPAGSSGLSQSVNLALTITQ